MEITDKNHVEQEISAYETQLAYLNEMKQKVDQMVDELSDSYGRVINAKAMFEQIKKENIEELRTYKYAITKESKEIQEAMQCIRKAVDQVPIAEIQKVTTALTALSEVVDTKVMKALRQ